MNDDRPRLAPDRDFPPYAFTGEGLGFPHPRNDPRGHSRDLPETTPPPLDPARWRESEAYLFGLDLFNHGYYWEAHEEWEGLWVAAGKRGAASEFFKGLIKLAAAGVKARQQMPDGVRRHGERAAEHFREARRRLGKPRYAGLDLADLERVAREVARTELPAQKPSDDVTVVFDQPIVPE